MASATAHNQETRWVRFLYRRIVHVYDWIREAVTSLPGCESVHRCAAGYATVVVFRKPRGEG